MKHYEEQLSLFDLFPKEPKNEPEIGAFVEQRGAVICHIMRPNYIGKKVVYDCSTASRKWLRCGVLEDYIPHEGHYRSIIFVGEKQRILLDHWPGREIYEPLEWDEYPKRRSAWGKI